MRKLIFILSIFLIATSSLIAQPISSSTYESLLEEGDVQESLGNLYGALDLYKEAYKVESSNDLAYRIAKLNFQLRDYKNAQRYYTRAMRRMPEGKYPDAYYYKGISEMMLGNYADALSSFKEFKLYAPGDPMQKRVELDIQGVKLAQSSQDPPRIKITNAGISINSSNQEYSPFIDNTGNLYYASYGKSGYIKTDNSKQVDIRLYEAKSDGKGSYKKGRPLSKKLNQSGIHTTNLALSPQEDIMVFTRMELDIQSLNSSKLYIAKKMQNGRWGKVEPVLGLEGDFTIKNPVFGELYGKDVLFFASDMESGLGGFDLYYANKIADNQYDSPVNLGEGVNTPFDEVTPYYREGELYFSSNGYPSLGGYDVFKTVWSGQEWSKPQNMGKGFNSSYDDRYFKLDPSGKVGVLASNRPPTRSVKSKTCCDDIFLINVEPVVINLLVKTVDEMGQPLAGVTLDLATIEDGDTTVHARKLNPKANQFTFQVFDGMKYTLIARKQKFEDGKESFNTIGITEATDIEKTVVLIPVEEETVAETDNDEYVEVLKNQPIRLSNIYYDFDDDKILPSAEKDLNKITELMQEYPDMVIEMGSHTDAQGTKRYNQKLSQRRAQSAVDYIVSKGIARNRLVPKGYGESIILNECTDGVECNDDQHRFNRRTEFKILQGPTSIRIKTGQKVKSNKTGGVINEMSSLFGEKNIAGLPVLKFDKREIDFGLVKKGEKRTHTYKFKNVGEGTANIGIVTACNCTTLDWTRSPIPPGGEGKIDIIFDSSEKDAGEMIGIDIILDESLKNGNGIIERVMFEFKMPND